QPAGHALEGPPLVNELGQVGIAQSGQPLRDGGTTVPAFPVRTVAERAALLEGLAAALQALGGNARPGQQGGRGKHAAGQEPASHARESNPVRLTTNLHKSDTLRHEPPRITEEKRRHETPTR